MARGYLGKDAAWTDGLYGYVIILGENRWEEFQIWLDGDPKKAFNDWSLEEMEQDPSASGTFYADVSLTQNQGGEFQIVRNRDWNQVLYPTEPYATENSSFEVVGPDDMAGDLCWFLDPRSVTVFGSSCSAFSGSCKHNSIRVSETSCNTRRSSLISTWLSWTRAAPPKN